MSKLTNKASYFEQLKKKSAEREQRLDEKPRTIEIAADGTQPETLTSGYITEISTPQADGPEF